MMLPFPTCCIAVVSQALHPSVFPSDLVDVHHEVVASALDGRIREFGEPLERDKESGRNDDIRGGVCSVSFVSRSNNVKRRKPTTHTRLDSWSTPVLWIPSPPSDRPLY